ncbi:MAG: DUF1223 domain-containing protein [Alphaproteobacteria bacterium]
MRSLVMAAALLLFGASAQADGRPVLVELFTSQGCSSCPAADSFMEELVRTDGVVALTYPVDIWDYLGWRDTLAAHEYSVRQQTYAPNLPSRSVYTPQMVIGGIGDVVGSRRDDALAMIAAHAAKETPSAAIALTASDTALVVEIAESQRLLGVEATVTVARLSSRVSVDIGGGENAGRTIVYSNVVRELAPVGAWRGEALRLEIPLAGETGQTADRIAVFVQRNGQGPVLGAAIIDLAHAEAAAP